MFLRRSREDRLFVEVTVTVQICKTNKVSNVKCQGNRKKLHMEYCCFLEPST